MEKIFLVYLHLANAATSSSSSDPRWTLFDLFSSRIFASLPRGITQPHLHILVEQVQHHLIYRYFA